MPCANLDALCPSIPSELDWLAKKQIHRACRSFHRHRYAIAKKNEVEIE